jgi:hypothetical protein
LLLWSSGSYYVVIPFSVKLSDGFSESDTSWLLFPTLLILLVKLLSGGIPPCNIDILEFSAVVEPKPDASIFVNFLTF